MKYVIIVFTFIAVLFSIHSISLSQSTEFKPKYKILFIGHLNFDSVQDTVVGRSEKRDSLMFRFAERYLLDEIRWGITEKKQSDNKGAKQKTTTRIILPNWKNLRTSVYGLNINQDTVKDLLINVYGKSYNVNKELVDSTITITVFGQDKLCSMENLTIEKIQGIKTEPFVAVEMRNGLGFESVKDQSVAQRRGYMIKKILLNVHQDTSLFAKQVQIEENEYKSNGSIVKVYPNPAGQFLNISGELFERGIYKVILTDVTGNVVSQQNVEVKEDGSMTKVLALDELASGCYVAQIFNLDGFYKSLPFTIIH